MDTQETFWRRCSNCKKTIGLGAKYWLCSVASCSKVRAPTQFCSPDCWAVHEEVETHKNAWAVEQLAPKTPEVEKGASAPPASVSSSSGSSSASTAAPRPKSEPKPTSSEDDVLVVVSRLKDYIKEVSSMSTSDQVLAPFSVHVRRLIDATIESAKKADRKTVLGRDVPKMATGSNDVVLVVVSRLKEYVRTKSEMRTSDDVPGAISDEIRRLALFAIENARKDGRKTVMGRDVT